MRERNYWFRSIWIYIFLKREIFNYLNFFIFALQYRKDFSVENIFVEIFNIFFYQYHFIFANFFIHIFFNFNLLNIWIWENIFFYKRFYWIYDDTFFSFFDFFPILKEIRFIFSITHHRWFNFSNFSRIFRFVQCKCKCRIFYILCILVFWMKKLTSLQTLAQTEIVKWPSHIQFANFIFKKHLSLKFRIPIPSPLP